MRLLILILSIFSTLPAISQAYREELKKLCDVSALPAYRNEPVEQISSYDRTGGNDDGFSGKFSYLRKEGDLLIIADLKGPGVVNRIWTPTPSNDTIMFFFDGETDPRIKIPFIDMFSGKRFPFLSPLCGNEIGGFFCYLPIPYSKSLKIAYKGEGLKFHQTQFRSLSKKSKIESYSEQLMSANSDVFEDISRVWRAKERPFTMDGLYADTIKLTIAPGERRKLFNYDGPGRIVGFEVYAAGALNNKNRDLTISARWDNDTYDAMNLPIADLFGYAYGKPSMRSFLCGSDSNGGYCYFPMPFDSSAQLNIDYIKREGIGQPPIVINAIIYYSKQGRDPQCEGRFYTSWNREKPADGVPYTIADIKGRGHYVGTSLIAQGLEGGMTLFWEGDDCSIVDGDTTLHGTGSEDYFNGGWYAVADRWDRGIMCPIHGSLAYDLKSSRTGGYRFLISDKINFNKSYNLTIEHGPEGNMFDVDYSSVAYFYADAPIFSNTPVTTGSTSSERLEKHIIMAQDFTTRLYWFTSLTLEDGYADLTSEQREHWTTNIDFEAVPMVQIDLGDIDPGRYKLEVTYTEQPDGGMFTLWQRTKQLSEWIDTGSEASEVKTINAGEIVIDDQLSTITIRRKKEGKTTIRINSFTLYPTGK